MIDPVAAFGRMLSDRGGITGSILRIGLLVLVLVVGAYAFRDQLLRLLFFRAGEPPPQQRGLSLDDLPNDALATIARDLEIPWEIAFLPDGGLLVTERPGRLVHFLEIGGERRSYPVDGVRHTGEGGLMGLALDPQFAENRRLYLYYTSERQGRAENRIERYRLGERGLTDREVILEGIPGAMFHDGGRIAFGPDGYLWATTGDATNPDLAQDRNSLAGKILRLTADGGIPKGNPFGSLVYSYGHRNPQGLAWDAEGRLWSTEHGRSGARTGMDELNLIERGANYGWPVIEGDQTQSGMIAPVIHSGPDYTWAPAGAAHLDGRIYFGGLRGEALYEAILRGESVSELRVHFARELGRIRVVGVGPDGMLYLATGNRDGRGRVREGDDRILRIDPGVFR